MSFEAAWGFDPDKVTQDQNLSESEIDKDKLSYSAEEQRCARIPADVNAQIYELRRIFRL